MKKIPYLLIVGEKEHESGSVSVRKQSEGDQGTMKMEDFKDFILKEIQNQLEFINQ